MAEPLRAIPEASLLRELDKLLNLLAPDAAGILRRALLSARAGTDLRAMEAAIRRQDWTAALEAVPWKDSEPGVLRLFREGGPVAGALRRGAELGLRLLPGGAGFPPGSPPPF